MAHLDSHIDVPVALRRWFVAHFIVDLAVALPLLIAPVTFLEAIGWTVVDPTSARVVAAALIAIGVQSFTARNDGVEAYRTMLNFKLLWSWSAVGCLLVAAADGGPDPVWAFMAVFIGFSGVWFHYRVRVHQMESAARLEASIMAPPTEPAASESAHDPAHDEPGDAERVHAGTSFDQLGAEDIAAFAAEEDRKRAAISAAATPEEPPNGTLIGMPAAKVAADEEEMSPEEIAALLSGGGGGDDNAASPDGQGDAERANADEIAWMMAGGSGETEGKEITPDEIATLLASQSDDPRSEEEARELTARLEANEHVDDQGRTNDIEGMMRAQGVTSPTGEHAAQLAADDDIQAMLAAARGEEPAIEGSEPDAGGMTDDAEALRDEETRGPIVASWDGVPETPDEQEPAAPPPPSWDAIPAESATDENAELGAVEEAAAPLPSWEAEPAAELNEGEASDGEASDGEPSAALPSWDAEPAADLSEGEASDGEPSVGEPGDGEPAAALPSWDAEPAADPLPTWDAAPTETAESDAAPAPPPSWDAAPAEAGEADPLADEPTTQRMVDEGAVPSPEDILHEVNLDELAIDEAPPEDGDAMGEDDIQAMLTGNLPRALPRR